MTELKLTPNNLQLMSDGIQRLCARCDTICFRLTFLDVLPTVDQTGELLAELNQLRDDADRIWLQQEWLSWFARAAASQNSLAELSADLSWAASVHDWALQVSWRFLMAMLWHGQHRIPMPEAMNWQLPAELATLDVEIVANIAREYRGIFFEVENIKAVMEREAAVAVVQLTESLAATSGGGHELHILRAIVDEEALQVATAIVGSGEPVDCRLRDLYRVDCKYIWWPAPKLARLLSVSEQAVRKTDAWKVARKEYLAAEVCKSVTAGDV